MTITMTTGSAGTNEGPEQSLATAVRRLIISGQRFRMIRARELQLGPSDLVALGHLHSEGSMAPKELSSLMGVTSGTMTALLDRVEKAGFLKREQNPQDRRGLMIHLTPAGQHAMEWLYEQFDSAVRDSLSQLPGISTDGLEKLLTRISGSLEHGTDGTPAPGQGIRQPARLRGV